MSPTSQRQYMMEIEQLRAELAAVKAERDELRDQITEVPQLMRELTALRQERDHLRLVEQMRDEAKNGLHNAKVSGPEAALSPEGRARLPGSASGG